MSERPPLLHVNLSPTLGGAEAWTADFTHALGARGWRNRLATGDAAFWTALDAGDAERVLARSPGDLASLAREGEIVIVHAPVPKEALAPLAARHRIVGVAHQAVYDGRRPSYYETADRLLAVSRHVVATLEAAGLRGKAHPDPLYGVAQLRRSVADDPLRRGPLCEWDRRKARDRVLGAIERIRAPAPGTRFERAGGLALGIVSRIAPLKQFPAMFAILAPLIARRERVCLEVFGAAIGYRALRELRAALGPLRPRTRWWGHQRNVVAAYRAIDWMMTGLPEREALGLNVIECAAAGTPVLAVDAPPFTETMLDGVTGFLYPDPRHDAGAGFARLLDRILAGEARVDRSRVAAHLEQFSFEAFARRADGAMHEVAEGLGRAHPNLSHDHR